MFRKRKRTLQVHIATIFIALITLLGITLTLFSYQNAKVLQKELASELTHKNADQLKITFEKLTLPVLTSLDTLALAPFIHSDSEKEKAQWLAAIQAIMARNPEVVSIYYGRYDESSFFIRSTVQPFMKEVFDAPEKASLMVDINHSDGTRDRQFYDKSLSLLVAMKQSDVDYKPTTRPWFQGAPGDGSVNITEPYMYYFIKRLGVTLSRKSTDGDGVLAADFTLKSLSHQLSKLSSGHGAQLALLDGNRQILAHSGLLDSSDSTVLNVSDLAGSPLQSVAKRNELAQGSWQQVIDGETWQIDLVPILLGGGRQLWLAEAVPYSDLLSSAISSRNKQILITVAGILASSLMVWAAARAISQPLSGLSKETEKLREFDFAQESFPRSRIVEVDNLARSVELLSATLKDFLRMLHQVANSQDFNTLLEQVVDYSQMVSGADTVMMWTADSDNRRKFRIETSRTEREMTVNIDNLLAKNPGLDGVLKERDNIFLTPADITHLFGDSAEHVEEAFLFPLTNRDKELVGMILLGFSESPQKEQLDQLTLIGEFLNFAALTKENLDRVTQQKALFKSFVELIASAIDTKSPYTGGHCQRVPELTFMIAEAAARDTQYFPDFSMDEKDREALHIAAWLHDCGKVTTPEYVVDKATKLETIYDRIHEVRMRFEVLKNEAEIAYWRGIADGGDEALLREERDRLLAEIDADFAFVAECNIGGEFMSDDRIARLKAISEKTWKRTLDDTLGLSWVEANRRARREQAILPCREPLLADREEHEIEWEGPSPKDDPNWKFTMQAPDNKFHRGELYNLSVRRGTLNDEERFAINDHIVQTIMMLRKLPYPKHMKRVPEIAGGHHEKMDGTGYPLGLQKGELALDARMMAIADIFEALTASDRPYKKAKTLSEALKILAFMVKDQHVDSQLFRLFLRDKIYLSYAEAFLPESQHDEVDEHRLLVFAGLVEEEQELVLS